MFWITKSCCNPYCLLLILISFLSILLVKSSRISKCVDKDMNCAFWVAKNPESCFFDENVIKYCKKICRNCGNQTILEEISESYFLNLIKNN